MQSIPVFHLNCANLSSLIDMHIRERNICIHVHIECCKKGSAYFKKCPSCFVVYVDVVLTVHSKERVYILESY